MGDLFDDLYRPRSTRYGDDIETERTGDPLPDHHGYRYHLHTGCRCDTCVAGCERERAKVQRRREYEGGKPKPWARRNDVEPALTYDEWKAARSA